MISDTSQTAERSQQGRYLWFLMLSYAMVTVVSNWYDARLVLFFGLVISPGSLTFPFSFLLSDAITEVYGFKNARKIIWAALLFNVLFLAFGQLVIHLPTPLFASENNAVFDKFLALNMWIVIGSFVSYLVSEPMNSYIIAILKIKWKGEYLGIRFVISTIIASLIDSFFFILIAYHTSVSSFNLFKMIISIWIIKSVVEIIGLPFSTRLTKWLKKKEELDIYDTRTNFSLFSLDTEYKKEDNHYSK